MRKSIGRPGSIVSVAPPNLLQVSKEEVAANSASARKMVGRTAEALNKLREAARKEGREEGFEAGFQAGRVEGMASIEDEYRSTIEEFKSCLQEKADQITFAAQQWTLDAEQSLAELAVVIAARVVSKELETSHDVIVSIAKEVVREFAHSSSIRIRTNPFDAPCLAARKDELVAVSAQLRNVEVVEDATIVGGCIVESEGGSVDSTIETRLKCVLESIREAA